MQHGDRQAQRCAGCDQVALCQLSVLCKQCAAVCAMSLARGGKPSSAYFRHPVRALGPSVAAVEARSRNAVGPCRPPAAPPRMLCVRCVAVCDTASSKALPASRLLAASVQHPRSARSPPRLAAAALPPWYECDCSARSNCMCPSLKAPGGLRPEEIPQFVLWTVSLPTLALQQPSTHAFACYCPKASSRCFVCSP